MTNGFGVGVAVAILVATSVFVGNGVSVGLTVGVCSIDAAGEEIGVGSRLFVARCITVGCCCVVTTEACSDAVQAVNNTAMRVNRNDRAIVVTPCPFLLLRVAPIWSSQVASIVRFVNGLITREIGIRRKLGEPLPKLLNPGYHILDGGQVS